MSKKLKTFKNTCDKSYDRHFYVIKAKSGKMYRFDDSEMMRAAWMQKCKVMEFESVLVLDACQYE